jgi:hypothetical protein
MTQGYYSLVQYCPDRLRLEVCNIGVLLFCPELQYLDVVMTEKIGRIHDIFGKDHSLDYVHSFKDSFARRISREKENILSLESLEMFINTRANHFCITAPRSMSVIASPAQELQRLSLEIFTDIPKQRKPQRPSIRMPLRKAIKACEVLENRVAWNLPKVQIHGFTRTFRPYLGFLNGRFNMVFPEHFTLENSFFLISRYLFMGQKLYENRSEIWGEQRLILLADAEDNAVMEQIEDNRATFDKHSVTIRTNVDDMVEQINAEAKDIPDDIRTQIAKQLAA